VANAGLKLAYAVQLSVEELCRTSANPTFGTFTFQDNVEDKGEAEIRFSRLRERLRRAKPTLRFVGVWQRQERGAWHVHLVIDRQLDITWLRPIAIECGFGSFINLRRIKPTPGFRDMGGGRKVAQYISRYVTRDERRPEDKGVRLVCWMGGAKVCNQRFAWANGLQALWRRGRGLFYEMFEYIPEPAEWWIVVRMGWELMTGEEQERAVSQSLAIRRWWDPEHWPPDPF